MTFHESGIPGNPCLLLVHPLGTDWTVFSRVVPALAEHYHVIVPALPGMDPDDPHSEFSSLPEICAEIEQHLLAAGISSPACIYGCSLGGSVVLRLAADGVLSPRHIIADAGITPYRLPEILCRLICCGDFLMTELGKHASVKALGYMFDTQKYTAEDLLYVKACLARMSARTIWRAFWYADNDTLPPAPIRTCVPVHYWYGEAEKKARRDDIRFVRETFPGAVFRENKGQDHAEFFTLHPQEFVRELLAELRDA